MMTTTQDSSIQCERSASDLSHTSSSQQNQSTERNLTRRRKLKPSHISTSQDYQRPTSSKSTPSRRVHKKFPNGSTESLSSSTSSSSHNDPRSVSRITCQLSKDYPGYFEYLRPSSVFRKPLRRSLSLPDGFKDSYKLQHPELTEGDREYLRHKAAVYSMSNMKKGAEWRFRQAIQHQIDTGFHTKAECKKYLDYLDSPRKRQFGTDPRVWRNPPKMPPRPLHFHRRSATVPSGFERSQSAKERREDFSPASSRRGSNSSTLPASWKDSALYYDPETKRTIAGRRKPDPKVK
ncbi:uncharacterized protein [Apostichopus japonicus]|uniref:uncharacterized protein isoform X2 n=1 Tax=Stichopus japonicus TaxID=307972 RepID=UPI003AB7C9DF